MKTKNLLSAISTLALAVVFFAAIGFAQTEPVKTQNQTKAQVKSELKTQTKTLTKGFVDVNGDGINDNAIDSDGDGIPNGKDADFVKPQDGSGQKFMKGKSNQNKFSGNKYGPGNGTGTGIGPKDGTGYGTPSGTGTGTGTGTCDGTGPKGKRGGR